MAVFTCPTDIAQEALKQLVAYRVPPTPDHYQRVYCEIAGLPLAADPPLEELLVQWTRQLDGTFLSRAARALDQALSEKNLAGCKAALEALREEIASFPAGWGELIKNLLAQWETPHKGWTLARKREELEQVLACSNNDPRSLFAKLAGLIESWSSAPAEAETLADPVPEQASPVKGGAVPARGRCDPVAGAGDAASRALLDASSVASPKGPLLHAAASPAKGGAAPATIAPAEESGPQTSTAHTVRMLDALRELLVETLKYATAAQTDSDPQFAVEVDALCAELLETADEDALARIAGKLKRIWLDLEFRRAGDIEVQEGLLRLLRLLVENVAELLADEQWLRGQISVVSEIISNPPDARAISHAERSLKEAIYRQGMLKLNLMETRVTFKNMIATFIDRLGEMSNATGEYHDKMEGYSQKIACTDDIASLSEILTEVLRETRVMQASARRSRDELAEARQQVSAAEGKIRQLEAELARVSEKVREDQLTGTLNRRGLSEAFEREAARSDRHGTSLCVAMLDVDDFKQLNDRYGHKAGDEALKHLTQVIRKILRPSDTVARYGGEEFLILLPETELTEAAGVMMRLQRELTKKFLLHNNERLLITFSAGVTARQSREPESLVLDRVDKALYRAKQEGKNRVVAVP